ncbi:hypothetical protein L227DRAFT_605121 [Lentinus tigrinus ALCF2SS1-6]|uniref:Uncharacterized protein n=1 Tax=Lentinus tigrinus ALCF2SS1-6 TaxID=1328759 RepID=A0A5C2STM4_9APHY|nr:hypothetical protein L227DRAFT_605121 [Lentinus tigrinus ALCF2SS1-6]
MPHSSPPAPEVQPPLHPYATASRLPLLQPSVMLVTDAMIMVPDMGATKDAHGLECPSLAVQTKSCVAPVKPRAVVYHNVLLVANPEAEE